MPDLQQTGGFKTHAVACAMTCAMLTLFGPCTLIVRAQRTVSNLDESKVQPYTLPDPLVSAGGRKVITATQWKEAQRPELLRLFEAQMYGKIPQAARSFKPRFQVKSEDSHALGGSAARREVTILLSDKPDGPSIELLLYLPTKRGRTERAPAFVGMNFRGNHTIHADPAITRSRQWMRDNGKGVVKNQATESSRGTDASSWPVERILEPRLCAGDILLRRRGPGL